MVTHSLRRSVTLAVCAMLTVGLAVGCSNADSNSQRSTPVSQVTHADYGSSATLADGLHLTASSPQDCSDKSVCSVSVYVENYSTRRVPTSEVMFTTGSAPRLSLASLDNDSDGEFLAPGETRNVTVPIANQAAVLTVSNSAGSMKFSLAEH